MSAAEVTDEVEYEDSDDNADGKKSYFSYILVILIRILFHEN